MSDIPCGYCHEPWDRESLTEEEDCTPAQRAAFLAGKGCWSCGWGTSTDRARQQTPESIEARLWAAVDGDDMPDDMLDALLEAWL